MSLKRETPCDYGECPYNSYSNTECEWWCGADEPQDNPEVWEEDEKDEERKTIWLIIEDAIENIYQKEWSSIDGDKIMEDLCRIQTCIDKKIYDREEN